MSHNKHFREIESLQFQIQFSVVGGFNILQLAMERSQTLLELRLAIAEDAKLARKIHERIALLLSKVETETQLSYDESIAAYLFCLFKESPAAAKAASKIILEHGGLWWSVQLAVYVRQQMQTELA